ncbi:MAG TPA: metal-dependent hydrolase [Candidatus Dormibacteraeota bacterium]|nr:metal-dependent hydrolase [Candidatus Dormibacteraeota bacterium]
MDTITHGIAGALLGKAMFNGEAMFGSRAMSRARIITWSMMLGAIFPDADVLRDIFSGNELLVITWHRSITHSLLCLPIFALLLAWITRWLGRWRKWVVPSFTLLTAIYAAGILSHIFLDLCTSFGTMIWTPLERSRPAWDLLFIIDFTFTALLLIPQWLAWAYAQPENLRRRTIGAWLFFLAMPIVVASIGQRAGAAVSERGILGAMILISVFFLLPTVRGWGLRISPAAWNRAGFIAACVYVGFAIAAHHAALARVQKFVALEKIDAQSIGALPLPPSLWHWDGLIRAPRGVYELRMDLSGTTGIMESTAASSEPLEYGFYPEALPNGYIEQAKQLPEVQKVLWFARFPVTRFHKEGSEAIVEISDLRFRPLHPGRAPSFTYRVRFDAAGKVMSQGWVTQ